MEGAKTAFLPEHIVTPNRIGVLLVGKDGGKFAVSSTDSYSLVCEEVEPLKVQVEINKRFE